MFIFDKYSNLTLKFNLINGFDPSSPLASSELSSNHLTITKYDDRPISVICQSYRCFNGLSHVSQNFEDPIENNDINCIGKSSKRCKNKSNSKNRLVVTISYKLHIWKMLSVVVWVFKLSDVVVLEKIAHYRCMLLSIRQIAVQQ